ncbi:MAG: hypothetical protein MAGBODY4_01556 [Candidatus Marinimicrobia bacterium]|nr:hypothetical protein [Candidatus Neomarinimicrobiota bacterium]
MIRVNLLEEDRLGKEPLKSSQITGEAPEEEKEVPTEPEEEQQPTPEEEGAAAEAAPEDESRVKIPRSKKRQPGQPPKKRQPQEPPLSRGPSTGIIVFLFILAVGVTVYFMFFHKPKGQAPVPVATDTTTQEVQPAPEEKIAVTEEAPEQAKGPTQTPGPTTALETPATHLPQSAEEIQQAVSLGKRKLESAYRLLSNVQAQSRLGFLSIGNQHLTLSALTNSRTFANRVRRQITNTSIVKNIELFDVQGINRGGYKAEVNVYGNLKSLEEKPDSRGFRSTDIGNVHRVLKVWIAIPTIELIRWNTKQVTTVDGWNRGPVYIQMEGTHTGIIRVIHALKNHGYNFSVSKIYVSTPHEVTDNSPIYNLKLYLTMYGKASV